MAAGPDILQQHEPYVGAERKALRVFRRLFDKNSKPDAVLPSGAAKRRFGQYLRIFGSDACVECRHSGAPENQFGGAPADRGRHQCARVPQQFEGRADSRENLPIRGDLQDSVVHSGRHGGGAGRAAQLFWAVPSVRVLREHGGVDHGRDRQDRTGRVGRRCEPSARRFCAGENHTEDFGRISYGKAAAHQCDHPHIQNPGADRSVCQLGAGADLSESGDHFGG